MSFQNFDLLHCDGVFMLRSGLLRRSLRDPYFCAKGTVLKLKARD